MTDRGFMVLGVALTADGDQASPSRLADQARLAEAGTLDFISLGYPAASTQLAARQIQFDALSVAAALMSVTRRIGLCAVVPTLYWEPFNIARAFSTLDNLSRGRAAWHVDPVPRPYDLENFSTRPRHDSATAYARTREFLDVTLALWDSWEDGAIVLDKANAVFTDHRKVHRINHKGEHFTVEGPLNAPRPVQGRPPIMLSDPSAAGLALASAFADVVIAATVEEAAALKGRGVAARVLVDLPVDGDPARLADRMAGAFADGACDGFNLFSGDLEIIVSDIVPELRRRGLFRAEYSGSTLREHLGLSRPVSRYSHV